MKESLAPQLKAQANIIMRYSQDNDKRLKKLLKRRKDQTDKMNRC